MTKRLSRFEQFLWWKLDVIIAFQGTSVMASLDKRWSDDTGCTRVFIEQVCFFFFGGGTCWVQIPKVAHENFEVQLESYSFKPSFEKILKTYSRSLLSIFYIPYIPNNGMCITCRWNPFTWPSPTCCESSQHPGHWASKPEEDGWLRHTLRERFWFCHYSWCGAYGSGIQTWSSFCYVTWLIYKC